MITDKVSEEALLLYNKSNISTKEVRSYEVSLWTLQDEFITVLKWSDAQRRGTIQEPKMTIADDGTENLSFTIPMYLYQNGVLVENPIWYNTRNGNLIVNLRKIKVIFNKLTNDEAVFEFLITKVTEEHEADHLFCNVECEGLAFHELGKIGYTKSISGADFELSYKSWEETREWINYFGNISSDEPIQNIQYWCNQLGLQQKPFTATAVIDPRIWYYSIQMDWSSFQQQYGERDRDTYKLYEEDYVTSWTLDQNETTLIPRSIEHYREKQRVVEAQESNIYNITQTIAETFGVYCRYKYDHDANYHITGRTIIFFNNYIHDKDVMSLTYPYSSAKISREMDSTDTVTKLYVKSVENNETLLGEDSIRYCEANKIQEDYILNFDYLKETNSISQEQYDEIEIYERKIHKLNSEIYPIQNRIAMYENQLVELDAKINTYNNTANLTEEQINKNGDLMLNIVANGGDPVAQQEGVRQYTKSHPDPAMVITDESGSYINLMTREKGIRTDTVQIYRGYSGTSVNSEIDGGFYFENDDYGNPRRIYNVQPESGKSQVYLTYMFEPRLYYETINQTLQTTLNNANTKAEQLSEEKAHLEELLDHELVENDTVPEGLRQQLQHLINEKKAVMAEFEYMMGPALREGNWTPENYQDYGERHSVTKSLDNQYDAIMLNNDTGNEFDIGWDSNLFDTEQDIFYESGTNQEKIYYPCINLKALGINSLNQLPLEDYSFIFNTNYHINNLDEDALNDIRYIRSFKIGSEAILGFVTQIDSNNSFSNEVIPVLILIGAKTMTTTGPEGSDLEQGGTIGFMKDINRGRPRLGIIATDVEEGRAVVNITTGSIINISSNCWLDTDNLSYVAVYPRLKFTSLMLKTKDQNFFIRYNNQLLQNYEDYYILNRNIQEGTYAPEFYITLKPFNIIKEWSYNESNYIPRNVTCDYTLSNAGTAIYLDALEIAKENAYPKVSYTVDPNLLNRNIISTLYNKLNYLVMINDVQLKLENTFGYISKLELDLDSPDKDSIEIKNYKSKFEDLFSTIVASTESMKSNEGIFNAISNGSYVLSATGARETLEQNKEVFDKYIEDLVVNSDTVADWQAKLWNDAASIIGAAESDLDYQINLTDTNAKILNAFADRVADELNPHVFVSPTMPQSFKKGDIWIEQNEQGQEIGRYVAISSSSTTSNRNSWNKLYGGSLAALNGAFLQIDATQGIINMTTVVEEDAGQKTSDSGIYLAAEQFNSTSGNTLLSKISIEPQKIDLGGAAEINIFSAVNQEMFGANAISLNHNGIKIASTAGISLFSGDISNSGANIELKPTHLFLGVNNTGENNTPATAVKITPSSFVISSGASEATTLSNGTLTGIADTNLTGVKISNSFFGVVTKSQNNVNAIIMNENGLTLAHNLSGTNITYAGQPDLSTIDKQSSSYVRLSGNGITISSGATLNISASDLMINTDDGLKDLDTYGNATFKMDNGAIWAGVKAANKTSNGSSLSISESQVKLQSGDAYIDLAYNKLYLHVNNNNYIHINNSGIDMKGRDIIINEQPVWSHNNIIWQETKPVKATDWPNYSEIIWFQPVTSGIITYQNTTGNYDTFSSSGPATKAVILSSTSNTSPPASSNYFRYSLSVTLTMPSSADDVDYTCNFTATLLNTSQTISQDMGKVENVSLRKGRNTTINFYADGGRTNVGENNLNIRVHIKDSFNYVHHEIFSIVKAVLNIEIDSSSSGQFPCNVYYLKSS